MPIVYRKNGKYLNFQEHTTHTGVHQHIEWVDDLKAATTFYGPPHYQLRHGELKDAERVEVVCSRPIARTDEAVDKPNTMAKVNDFFISINGDWADGIHTGLGAVCKVASIDENIIGKHDASRYELRYPASGLICTVSARDLYDTEKYRPIELERVLTLSTAHLDEATADILNDETIENPEELGRPMAYDYGWIFVPLKVRFAYEDDGYKTPECLRQAALIAEECECNFLVFDSDAASVPWLPTYDW